MGGRRRYAVHVDEADRHRTTAARAMASSCPGRNTSPPSDEVRSQWHHVIDVAPTMLEAARLPRTEERQRREAGADRRREHAVCLRRTEGGEHAQDPVLRDLRQSRRSTTTAGLPARSTGRRGRRMPRRRSPKTCGNSTTRATTSACRTIWPRPNPAKLKELQELFLKEAIKNRVLPLDDRLLERDERRDGRPPRSDGRTHLAHAR